MAIRLQNALAILVALAALVYAFDFHNAFLQQAQSLFSEPDAR